MLRIISHYNAPDNKVHAIRFDVTYRRYKHCEVKNSHQKEKIVKLHKVLLLHFYVTNMMTISSLLSKNLKIKIYRTIIFPVVLYGCETWSLTFGEGHRLRVFEENIWA